MSLALVLNSIAAVPPMFVTSPTCRTLSSSRLAGFIDGKALSKLQYLEILDLSDNQIHGVIPPTLNNLPKLQKIWLSNNQISDAIPSNPSNLSGLQVPDLSDNQISGIIPPALNNLSSLESMDLSINLLTGEIPAELGNLSKLEDLVLHENLLEGTLTPALAKLENLSILTVASNYLTGKLPNDVVDGNNFFGQIPKYITKWKQLQQLSLLGNEFENPPLGFFNMPELRYLDLSFNKLTGGIPKSMENLKLDYLILTSNMLSGNVNLSWIKKMELA
ncbi:hypothetical protein Pint_09545 [Pistacia integerrima]|uniref:Uncharacterized protein n=1 Tax=Pistacia integerrima TaxID=434235 RepID=A0ACC0XLZ9_9ROSI|nr:hypothetical protein Pint_09545 [Pistacia integerrima]